VLRYLFASCTQVMLPLRLPGVPLAPALAPREAPSSGDGGRRPTPVRWWGAAPGLSWGASPVRRRCTAGVPPPEPRIRARGSCWGPREASWRLRTPWPVAHRGVPQGREGHTGWGAVSRLPEVFFYVRYCSKVLECRPQVSRY